MPAWAAPAAKNRAARPPARRDLRSPARPPPAARPPTAPRRHDFRACCLVLGAPPHPRCSLRPWAPALWAPWAPWAPGPPAPLAPWAPAPWAPWAALSGSLRSSGCSGSLGSCSSFLRWLPPSLLLTCLCCSCCLPALPCSRLLCCFCSSSVPVGLSAPGGVHSALPGLASLAASSPLSLRARPSSTSKQPLSRSLSHMTCTASPSALTPSPPCSSPMTSSTDSHPLPFPSKTFKTSLRKMHCPLPFPPLPSTASSAKTVTSVATSLPL
mmetsp:Transcript_71700/g.222538  ORF Transcript_71700/g.222538 Transcript_71700/m.222538 type:complete len:269 (-) Transcript_71700:516-1322(-)